MDPLSRYLLQLVDCNCNDCVFLERDFERTNKERNRIKASGRTSKLTYGFCKKKDNKKISFLPNTCQIETQDCFEHRRQPENFGLTEEELTNDYKL